MALLILICSLIFLDYLTKELVLAFLPLGSLFWVIPDFFAIDHVRNTGAAWGFLSQVSWAKTFFLIFPLVVLLILIVLLRRFKTLLIRWPLALIVAGAIGNLLDRIRLGSVVDFLHFQFGSYAFPSFNVADSCISIGALIMIVMVLCKRSGLEEDHD